MKGFCKANGLSSDGQTTKLGCPGTLFQTWFVCDFCLAVKSYCEKKIWKESTVTVGQCTRSPSRPWLLIIWRQSWSCVSSSKHNFSLTADGSGCHRINQGLLPATHFFSANLWHQWQRQPIISRLLAVWTWKPLKTLLRPGGKSRTTAWTVFGRSASTASWDSNLS